MKVIIAPQAFKGSVTGPQAARAIEAGVRRVYPRATAILVPIADGGDGTLEALVEATDGRYFDAEVAGPLWQPTQAQWGVMGDGKTAVIEMAQASGLALLPYRQRNPRLTSTYGTGQLIRLALDAGYRRIILGMGGSATNDGGAGMASALGVRFLDNQGRALPSGGDALRHLASIDVSNVYPPLAEAEIIAASDVDNPLCGPTGASAIYGPQKGASARTVQRLDAALARYAEVIKRELGIDVADRPGAGAAGGLGAGLIAFAGGEVQPGIDLVCDVSGLDEKLPGADIVITGEGRLDGSTVFNKAPVGVARRAAALGIPVIALAGILGRGHRAVYDHGITAIMAIADRPMSIRVSVSRTEPLLTNATERALRLLRIEPPQG